MSVANILLSLLPVATFLVMLIILDSFKLIKIKLVLLGILWGAICVGVAYFINRWLIFSDAMEIPDFMNGLIPPFFEEILKITFVIILIKYNRIGFMIDGAIYGFEQSMDNAFMNRIKNRTPVKGLYLASAWGNPGGGYGGVFRAGQDAFQALMEDWGS